MGCGGSRADAIIEPRYHESWTRETESTWLTNTDVETSLPVGNSKALEASLSLREKRMVNTGTQCGKQALTSTGSNNHQRRPRRSLSDVGVTGSSKPLVTPKGGHQKKPARCLRMGSPSISTIVETQSLGTCVMKDEEKPL
ncbi:brain and acute leukemia cytoplasmic protein isoform X1 [Sebastes umbrosus]|uniref:brain and acute leukemia cytoplasmic protein isoform X1 n=1 Tax=Sebastes umbrosus TaxID=72105 RepID=UPI00189F4960|nr:brain and acute leukemia cytoplasmic protein isoform X1 [Sebastes umbrosus]